MHADDEYFATSNDDVSLFDIAATGTDRLDFPAGEHQASLEFFFDEIVVKDFFINGNAHGGG